MAVLLLLGTEFRHWIVSCRDVDKIRRYEVTFSICGHGIFKNLDKTENLYVAVFMFDLCTRNMLKSG